MIWALCRACGKTQVCSGVTCRYCRRTGWLTERPAPEIKAPAPEETEP